jgi:hypothetical protein
MNVLIYQWVYKNLDIFFSIKCQHKNNILKNAFIKLAESFQIMCAKSDLSVWVFMECKLWVLIKRALLISTNLNFLKSQIPTITLNFYCRHFATPSVNDEEDGWNLVRWYFINVSIIHVQCRTCKFEDQFLWEREGERWMIKSIIHRCKIIPNAFIQIGLIWILFNFFGKINLNPFQEHCAL